MSDKWNFTCTRETFDGERIAREAKEAGLEIFEVAVKGDPTPVVFATERYARRLERAGVSIPWYLGSVVPTLNRRSEIYQRDQEGLPYRYSCFVHDGGYSAEAIHKRLLEAEAKILRVSVRGFK